MTDLNALLPPSSGWTLVQASAINNHGMIVGYGYNPAGQMHAFLLDTTAPSDDFDFTMPGWASCKMSFRQGNPPVLAFDLTGSGGYHRAGQTAIPTLSGCGTIQSVEVVGSQVVVAATHGQYVSRDGFIYQKTG